MKKNNTSNKQNVKSLVVEYEAMSQKGTVGFYEKTAFLHLINHYLNKELIDNALEVIGHAVNQHPFSGTFYIVQAQLYIEKNCENLALDALDKAMLYASSVFEVQILRSEALNSLGIYDEAFDTLDRLLLNATPAQKSEINLSKALIFENQKRYNDMFIALKKAVLLNPENLDALERVWFSVEMTQRYDESIRFHQRLLDIDPYSYIAWYNLGFAYSALSEHKSACDAFEYAFIINEKFEFAYRECAQSYIHLEKYDQALKCYDELQEHFEADTDLYLNIGLCHEKLGDIEKAKSFYFKARAFEKDNDEVYFRLGNCFAKEGSYKSAITSINKALLINGLKEEYYLALADIYHKIKDLDSAQNFFQKAVDIAPEINTCWIRFACFLMEISKNREALELLDEAEIYSCGSELMYCRIACLFSMDNRDEAFVLLNTALSKNYKSHQVLFEMTPTLKNDPEILNLISTFSF